MPARTPTAKSLAETMGARLRERRTALGLSVSEAARRASISPSYLSAVESGSSTASLPVLARIAHALDTTIGEFLAEDTVSRVRLDSFGAAPGLKQVSSDDLQLQVCFHTSEPGDTGDCPLPVDAASVVVYIRTGRLDVTVDDETWHLSEGDSLHAQEATAISWATPDAATTIVWAAAPADVSVGQAQALRG